MKCNSIFCYYKVIPQVRKLYKEHPFIQFMGCTSRAWHQHWLGLVIAAWQMASGQEYMTVITARQKARGEAWGDGTHNPSAENAPNDQIPPTGPCPTS